MRIDKMNRFLEWWKAPGNYQAESGIPDTDKGIGKSDNDGTSGTSGEKEARGGKERFGEKRYITLIKSFLLAALPLLCCLVYCAGEGRSLAEVYVPASEWNDELFYYKQVESILSFGYPQGYFGFNESHALKLSFAAWSPVLVFPWLLWGVVFGWNLMSPIFCNIFLMSLCCFLFVWLVRPTWKQMGVLTFLFCLYKPFVRYMLSAMAEVICFAILILFYSLAVNYLRREKDYKLVILMALSGLMVLMRPYMALFMLLPIFFWIRRGKGRAGKWRNGLAGAILLAAVLGIYVCINHYLGAEYFTPLFYTDWLSSFFEEGLFGGIYFTVRKLYYVGRDFLGHIQRGFTDGLASGAHFVGYLACMAVLAVQGLRDWRSYRRLHAEISENRVEEPGGARRDLGAKGEAKRGPGAKGEVKRGPGAKGEAKRGSGANGEAGKNPDGPDGGKDARQARRVWEKLVIEAHLAFCFVAMFFALLLMYKLTEGSRHLLTFMAAAVFVVALMDTQFYKKAVLIGVCFGYFYFYVPLDPFDYQVPYVEEAREASVETWREVLGERLVLEKENVPNYDNVVIWVFSDKVGGEDVRTSYQLLYGLPEGFGISCCMREFIIPNIDALKSRYIAVPAEGEIAMMCEARGCSLVYGDEELVLYELHGGR
ncbi:MAG TPA: hypothetical protein DCZ91_02150 [Lachnospiraceae bacterium]|nr:hypothetical protein [Lachnospiraceae bacterium]